MNRSRNGLFFLILSITLAISLPPAALSQPAACPTEPFPLCVDGPGEVCLELPFVGADSVNVGLAISVDNRFCFTADHEGRYDFAAVAYYGNESLACQLHVDVSFGLPPQINCPDQPFAVNLCQPGQVCLVVPTARASSIQTSAGEFAADDLCLQVDTSGVYDITLIATNVCGVDTCSFQVRVTIGEPPVISCPTEPVTVERCSLDEICVPLAITGADSVVVSQGSWGNGLFCVLPQQFGELTVEIRAYNECGFTVCTLTIVVSQKPATVLTCPQGTVSFVECGPNMVCVPITYKADSVRFSTGGFAEGQLCFHVSESSVIPVTATAWGPCGTVTCEFSVDVTILSTPTLVCPTDTLPLYPCVGREICFPLGFEAQNADSVRVDGGDWSISTLCFAPMQPGLHAFTIRAFNGCGVTTCERFVDVAPFLGPAVIACPAEPYAVAQCPLGEVKVPLTITDVHTTTIEGATWANDTLTFTATREGAYEFVVEAYGDCGADTCALTVVVSQSTNVIQATPLDLIGTRRDDGICCVEVPMPEGYQVSVQGGLWSNDSLCFIVERFDPVQFSVIGESECERYEQPVTVTVDFGCGPNFICPVQDPETWITCYLPDTVQLRLEVDDQYTVTVPGGWYDPAEDLLHFIVDTAGLYVWPFTVANECAAEQCAAAAWVELDPPPSACFTASADPQEPLTVIFENCGYKPGYFAWEWIFGDGFSTYHPEPSHTYTSAGCYEVRLVEYGACGADTLTDTICVSGNQIVQPTPTWLNLYCGAPTLDGFSLQIGDVIEVYDNNGVLCGLDTVAPHGFGFMPVYADDPFSLQDEGAEPGTLLSFKVKGQPVYAHPPVIWTQLGDRIPVCSFTTANCVRIPLQAGWNLISWDVAYSGPISDTLATISECVEVMLGWDGKGLSWDPMLPQYSTLHQVDYHDGYWIKMICDTALTLCAPPINPNDYIPLGPGWNLVSFWGEVGAPNPTAEAGFASILEDLDLAYTYANGYQIWKPGQGGGLSNLTPLAGYWLKMSAGDNLAYPGYGAGPMNPPPQSGGGGPVTTTTSWISVYASNLAVSGQPVTPGRAIAFWYRGTLCGLATYNGSNLEFTPVYGADSDTPAQANLPRPGDQVQIQIGADFVSPLLTWSNAGDRVNLNDLSLVVSADDLDTRPVTFALDQNYPNPFNPSTTIAFSLHRSGPAKLELFNIKGELVRTLIDQPLGSGEHRIIWDGLDRDSRPVAGGVYLYRLTASGLTETRKMVLIK